MSLEARLGHTGYVYVGLRVVVPDAWWRKVQEKQ